MKKKEIKNFINKLMKPLGFEIHRIKKRLPYPPLYEEPLEVIKRINSGEAAAINCKLENCVIYNGFSLGVNGWHPFKASMENFLKFGDLCQSKKVLTNYYSLWAPENALEALIGPFSGPKLLLKYPSHLMHAPWITSTPEERMHFTEKNVQIESSSINGKTLTINDGYGLHGPVTLDKLNFEHKRLVTILNSILKYGYLREFGDMTCQVLLRGEDYRCRLMHGHHRSAVLAVLGYSYLPIIPTMLIRRDEVDHWPQVYRGIWKKNEALAYFDHHFDFDSKKWAEDKGLI